jgi:hypothetical protein
MRFTSALAICTDEQTANQAFEAILWGIAVNRGNGVYKLK